MKTLPTGPFRKGVDYAAIGACGLMTLLVLYSIVLRYFFSVTYRWSDELIRVIFTWVVFLGIPIAYRHGDHVVIGFVLELLPAGPRRAVTAAIHVLIGVLVGTVGWYGFGVIFGRLGRALLPGMQVPRYWVYAAMPVGAVLVIVEVAVKLRELLGSGEES